MGRELSLLGDCTHAIIVTRSTYISPAWWSRSKGHGSEKLSRREWVLIVWIDRHCPGHCALYSLFIRHSFIFSILQTIVACARSFCSRFAAGTWNASLKSERFLDGWLFSAFLELGFYRDALRNVNITRACRVIDSYVVDIFISNDNSITRRIKRMTANWANMLCFKYMVGKSFDSFKSRE